jgi:glycosyltransferase involved in cell wall biosynthesis
MYSVSIIINNFNYASYVSEAIESALNQTLPAAEIIVVDDGSTDNSAEVINRYSDRIFHIEQSNAGQAAALNTGYAKSTGDIIIFLDADDRLKRSTVEELLNAWSPDYSKAHFPMDVIDGQGSWIATMPSGKQSLPSGNLLYELLTAGIYEWMPTSGNAYSRSTLIQIMPIPQERFRISADLYLSVRSVAFGNVGALQRPLSDYRIHGNNRYTSTRFFPPSTDILIARAQCTIELNKLLESERKNAGHHFALPEEIVSAPLKDWFNVCLAQRICEDGSRSIAAIPITYDCIHVRIALNNTLSPNTIRRLIQTLVFAGLRHLPAWILRAFWQCGIITEPYLRKLQRLLLAIKALLVSKNT